MGSRKSRHKSTNEEHVRFLTSKIARVRKWNDRAGDGNREQWHSLHELNLAPTYKRTNQCNAHQVSARSGAHLWPSPTGAVSYRKIPGMPTCLHQQLPTETSFETGEGVGNLGRLGWPRLVSIAEAIGNKGRWLKTRMVCCYTAHRRTPRYGKEQESVSS